MLVIQRVPFAWKRDEAALRRFVEAVLWICRTGAPWRDLPDALGRWPSVYHRWRRWCVRGWWELVFEALRPSLPADGLLLLDSTTCKAHRAASGAAHSTAAEELRRSPSGDPARGSAPNQSIPEQQSRKFASADAAARTSDAAVQIAEAGAVFSVIPRHDLWPLSSELCGRLGDGVIRRRSDLACW